MRRWRRDKILAIRFGAAHRHRGPRPTRVRGPMARSRFRPSPQKSRQGRVSTDPMGARDQFARPGRAALTNLHHSPTSPSLFAIGIDGRSCERLERPRGLPILRAGGFVVVLSSALEQIARRSLIRGAARSRMLSRARASKSGPKIPRFGRATFAERHGNGTCVRLHLEAPSCGVARTAPAHARGRVSIWQTTRGSLRISRPSGRGKYVL